MYTMWEDADKRLMDQIHARVWPKEQIKKVGSIGVIGYSGTPYDETHVPEYIVFGLSNMKATLEHQLGCRQFKIVSGLTNIGIPKEAYAMAKPMFGDDVITVGIACSKAKDFPQFPVDEKHIIGNEWGDESDFFLDYIDCLIRIGGGDQSMREANMFKERYPTKPIIEHDVPRK